MRKLVSCFRVRLFARLANKGAQARPRQKMSTSVFRTARRDDERCEPTLCTWPRECGSAEPSLWCRSVHGTLLTLSSGGVLKRAAADFNPPRTEVGCPTSHTLHRIALRQTARTGIFGSHHNAPSTNRYFEPDRIAAVTPPRKMATTRGALTSQPHQQCPSSSAALCDARPPLTAVTAAAGA